MLSMPPSITSTEPALLALLQISDSAFPNGGFAHSYGLETYVQEGVIHSGESLLRFLAVYLQESLATSDCLALKLAYEAAEKGELVPVLELDQLLSAQKLARESREASIKTGIRMLRVSERLTGDPLLQEFSRLVREGRTPGHHVLVFALTSKALGLGLQEAGLTFVYKAAAGMVNSGVRLIPLGQNEAQVLLFSLSGIMRETLRISEELSWEDLGTTLPGLEIRSMQHEYLYARLFIS